MNPNPFVPWVLALAALAALRGRGPESLSMQEHMTMSQPQQEAGPPGPGPEHQILERFAGTWDAKATFAPGMPIPPMTGTETNTIGCGGLWMIQDVKCASADGMPFSGHGVFGWDALKKKYVSAWVDSMAPMLATAEATLDKSGKVLTAIGEQPDMATGAMVKVRSVTEFRSADHRTFTVYAPGPDGKEFAQMTIDLRRRAK